VTIRYDVPTQH